MNRDTTLVRWLPRFAVGAFATLAFASEPAQAQRREPAATLSPARPALAPARPALAPAIVRGATPDSFVPSFTGPFVPSVPAPDHPPKAKSSWVGAKMSGLKETVVAKPTGKPTMPDNRLSTAPTSPLLGTGTAPSMPPQQPLQSIYASPPAYRWYGWGGTTPGANPHAPSGVYPQGSANWYSQTGATPGAFPDTRTRPLDAPAIEAPVYSGKPATEPTFRAGVPSKTEEAKPTPRYISEPAIPEPRIVARTTMGAEIPAGPTLPSGIPVAIASSPEGRALPAEPIAVPTTELNWQTAGGRGTLQKEPDPAPGPSTAPKSPTVSVIRGQLDGRDPQSFQTLIRNACVGRVIRTDARAITPHKFVVTFVAGSEEAARDAAALVVALPELKPYEVTFEAQIVPR